MSCTMYVMYNVGHVQCRSCTMQVMYNVGHLQCMSCTMYVHVIYVMYNEYENTYCHLAFQIDINSILHMDIIIIYY